MFLSNATYKTCFEKLVSEEKKLSVAVAFWGNGAEKRLYPDPTRFIRIICNLRTGGTNPKVIEHFLTLAKKAPQKVQIRQCDRLHAKIILGERQAIIGSANLSTNGLGLEDTELAHWIEAGFHIQNTLEMANVRQWFEELWDSKYVRSICREDIDAAREAWKRNRGKRPDMSKTLDAPFSIDQYTVDELKDRPAYALVFKKGLTKVADKARITEQDEATQQRTISTEALEWWAFEGWSKFSQLSKNPVDFISIRKKRNGRLDVEGVCRMLGRRVSFTYDDEKKTEGWIDLAQPTKTLLARPFGSKEAKKMAEQLESCIEDIWKSATVATQDSDGRWISLGDLAQIVRATTKK